jgi:hypothetical protein
VGSAIRLGSERDRRESSASPRTCVFMGARFFGYPSHAL